MFALYNSCVRALGASLGPHTRAWCGAAIYAPMPRLQPSRQKKHILYMCTTRAHYADATPIASSLSAISSKNSHFTLTNNEIKKNQPQKPPDHFAL